MKVTQIKGNTYQCRTQLIDLILYQLSSKNGILIDTGYHKTAKSEIIPYLTARGMAVKGIINTHGHIDHAGGNNILKMTYGSQIASPYVENMLSENSYNMYVMQDNLRFRVFGDTIPKFRYKTDRIINPDHPDFSFLGIDFGIINLHGHSPYQAGFITPDNVAYLGDVLISEEMIKKTKLPYIFDVGRDLKSKERLKNLSCDYYVLSHEGVYDEITSLVDQNIAHIQSRMDILLDLLKTPQVFEDYTANIVDQLGISANLRKIVYLQRTIRGYLAYFQEMDWVDAYLKDHKIYFVKK